MPSQALLPYSPFPPTRHPSLFPQMPLPSTPSLPHFGIVSMRSLLTQILASADATRPALPQVLSHLSVPLQARISGAPRLAGSMHELLAATFATLATHAMASEAQSPKEPITAGLVEIGEKSAGRAAAQGTGNAALWQSMLSRAIAADDPTGRLQEAALLAIAALVRCADPAQSPLAALMRPCAELAKSPHAHVHGALSTLLALCPPGCLSAISSDDATSAASGASKQGGAAHSAVRFLRQMLAADGVRSDPQRYAGVLRAVAAVTARVPKEEEAALVTGVVTLLSALDEPSLGNAALTPLCCEAGSLLSQLAASRGSTLAGLLRSLPLMLEYVARNLTSKPAIFLELADLVASEDPRGTEGPATSAGALAELMLPHVLPRLVALGDSQAGNLRRLAVHLGLGGSDPGQALLRERLHLALMVLFRDQRDGGDLEATRAFLKGAVVGEGSPEVFDNLLSLCAPKLFWEVLWATAGRPAFESLGEDLELPAEEVGECGRTLAAIANLMHRPGAKTGKRKAKRADGAVSIEEFLTSNGRIMQMMHYAGDFCDGRVPRGLSRMDNCPCSLEDTLRAVRLLPLLVHFLSRRLPDVVPQISALLTRAIETRDAAAAASRAPESVAAAALAGWATLVRCLAQRAPEELARVASHIVVVLLPLLEVGAASRPLAARVLRLLVVEHGPTIGADALRRLPPLPAGDGLEDISDALTRARGGATVRDRVELLLTGLTDEALSVRLASLSELRHNLCSSPTFVSALVDTDASRDSQLSALVSALLVCVGVDSRTALGRRIQHRSAECLGLIGAVDPSRVSLSIAVRFEVSRDPADFMKTLVERFLVRLLRASSGLSALANTMLAIQTLLDIGRAEGGGDAGSLFDSLSDAVKPLVKPFLSSKFVASDAARTPPREVLFAPGIELRPWLSLWIRQLSEASRGVWAGILAACRGVFAHDVPLMLFVLPNAVYQALQGAGQDAADMIRAEITAVLTTACRSPASVDPLVLQAVFGLLDVLSRYWWLHLLQQGRASSSAGTLLSMSAVSAQGTPEGLVRWVLDAVPHELRARASFAGGAHVRAQLYYETHLREANGNDGAGLNPASARPGRFSAEDAAFFHSICSRVGDPDGLASAAALHPGELPVEAQIALAEGAGAHSQALALYAQAARRARAEEDEEKEWELRAGRLRCLLGMGSPEQVLAVVDGVAATGAPSHHSSAIAAVGASAAWRMSRWDALDELLDAADGGLRQEAVADLGAGFPGPSLGGAAGAGRGEAPGSQLGTEGLWELRVGSALLALRNGDQESIRDALELARKEVLRPLSAASMESYARVYPLMVKLHVLQEIEDAAAHVVRCRSCGRGGHVGSVPCFPQEAPWIYLWI